ncbi:siphovirus Gp157 family protein [Marinobacter salarius]|jgi:hypothetical protein|uniref:siphovirus Gp157 family protein n=1 Tax=Marinobacter salarius TaxID=1420917 RepID=UPI0010AAC74B|nr:MULTISPECIES: siphovirus Gp157 family protein [Marinobacter]MBJ7302476.1 siphovirus Gp157 family protein [Marinobacter salarius]HIO30773.1 siphovirus Gp157 family protein [Marinobacter salarius]HIP01728.1 siphovirus Gp157 family protein [Marinobacter salarius]
MSQLYEITGRLKEIATVETEDEDFALALRDTLEGIEGEFNDKAVSVSHAILNLDSDAEAIDREIKRLQDRKRVLTNRRDHIREYLRDNMEAAGVTKISCPLFAITLAKGRENVVIDDKDKLPDECVRVKTSIEPDKTEISRKLKAGEAVEGAHMERSKSSIRIK